MKKTIDVNGIGRALTGAWIETDAQIAERVMKSGRALTGAWIETDVG